MTTAPATASTQSRPDSYRQLARIYDVLVGDGALPDIISAFERARCRHRIQFDSLADVGCGTGRFLKYLTRYPARLIGIDRSAAMLRIARRRLRHSGVRLLQQDMRSLALPEDVDAITVNFATLNYCMEDRDLDAALRSIARGMRPRGTLIFDFIPAAPAGEAGMRRVQRFGFGDSETIWHTRTDPRKDRSSVTITVRQRNEQGDTAVAVERHEQRWYHPRDMADAIERAGLKLAWLAPLPPGDLTQWWQAVAFRHTSGSARRAGS